MSSEDSCLRLPTMGLLGGDWIRRVLTSKDGLITFLEGVEGRAYL